MTDTPKSVELLPCPWCGERPRLDQRQTQSLWSSDEVTFSLVICDECEVSGKDFCDDHDGEEAIDWWNSRAHPAKSATCAKSQVGELPAGLNWDQAPANAVALIGGKIDDLHPERKLFVWVPELSLQTMGVLALPFDGRPAGSPQGAALDNPNSQWVLLATRSVAQVAKLPDGYCLMPRRLTAENGAKALLLGEFKVEVCRECPECAELDEPVEGCEICDGEGEFSIHQVISWDKIKFIYSKAVAGLALDSIEP